MLQGHQSDHSLPIHGKHGDSPHLPLPVPLLCCKQTDIIHRYALNYTKTPYRTTWVPLPDVAATRKKLGVPACRKYPDGTDFLTLPVLYDPATPSSSSSTTQQQQEEGTFIGDSFDIALHLHNKQQLSLPNSSSSSHPPLFPANTIALHRAFTAHIDTLFTLNGVLLAGYYTPFDPATASISKTDFARRAGVAKWEDLEIPPGSEQRMEMLRKFEEALEEGLARWFVKRDEGPWLEGGEGPMWADFVVGGWLMMMKECLPEWEELRGWSGGVWGRLHDALGEWRVVM